MTFVRVCLAISAPAPFTFKQPAYWHLLQPRCPRYRRPDSSLRNLAGGHDRTCHGNDSGPIREIRLTKHQPENLAVGDGDRRGAPSQNVDRGFEVDRSGLISAESPENKQRSKIVSHNYPGISRKLVISEEMIPSYQHSLSQQP